MHTATQRAKGPTSDHLVDLIHKHAANVFITRQLWCSEAVLSVLNRGLGGDLPNELAIRLGAGLGEGFGGGGCTCGALTGGAIAIGLFCGTAGTGLHRSRSARSLSRRLHDGFKSSCGSTCCRVLTKGLVQGSGAHFEQCAKHSAQAAAQAATLILEVQPGRTAQADWHYLNQVDNPLKTRLKIVNEFLRR